MLANSDVYFHVTLTRHVDKILRKGLCPRRGPRSRKLGEPHKAVYLFKSREDAENGLSNWLGDELSEDEPVALLSVRLPAGTLRLNTTAEYEIVIADRIVPAALTVVATDL